MLGCASGDFKPPTFAPDIPLQDAPPGKSVVYLIRAPHDRATLPVYVGTRKVAVLPPSTYTVAVLQPGTHRIAASANAGPDAPASALTVSAGERRFLYVSAPTARSFELNFIGAGRAGIIPLALPTQVAAGAHTWKECSELDAQGLMSIGKLVLPEPGVL